MKPAAPAASFSAMRAAIERALQLDPERDAEAACAAAAQALQQPLEAMLLVAHQAGLVTPTRRASSWAHWRAPATAEELTA